ncbi:thioredoxin-like protein [Apodospora peruviana]|uniref:Thioredoxin-like protein n=1 Tax=Apodospora peruviana TaxID=516989 RepID=A0AAE0IK33_9PEZI|nr:thioredoxin-like protein [Apodospora peruviana]
MEYLTYIVLTLLAVFVIAPALFADRSPIPDTSTNIHKITSPQDLEALLASSRFVVADFYADWCPPCRAIAPIFGQLADSHASKGKLAFAKINVDHVNDVAKQYAVSAMPTFLFFEDGKPKGVAVGSLRKRQSVRMTADGKLVDRILGADKPALEEVVKALAGQV